MRKSLILGTREDVSRMRNRNEAGKRSFKSQGSTFDEAMRALGTSVNKSTHPSQGRIVTFNHPILGNN